jgi:hypothetical protein
VEAGQDDEGYVGEYPARGGYCAEFGFDGMRCTFPRVMEIRFETVYGIYGMNSRVNT